MKKISTKKVVVRPLESILVLGFILFEELIWDLIVKPLHDYIKGLIVLAPLEKTFLAMNRHLLLAVFIFILVLTEALGLFSGFCFVSGYFYSGVLVYLLKIPLASFTFWLFKLTRETLLSFDILDKAYQLLMHWIDLIVESEVYRFIKLSVKAYRDRIKQLYRRYFAAPGLKDRLKQHYLHFKSLFLKA